MGKWIGAIQLGCSDSMRIISLTVLVVGACALGTSLAFAQPDIPANDASNGLIPSTADGALDEPSTWSCDRLLPEYKAWLDQGNDPNEWVHVGKGYYVFETGEKYSWNDWIDWMNSNGCVAEPLVQPEFAPAFSLLGPAIVTGPSVASAVAAQSASEAKSPG